MMKKVLIAVLLIGALALVALVILPNGPELTAGSLAQPLLLNESALEVKQGATTYCKPNPDGTYPHKLEPIHMGEAEDHLWVEGGGCLNRSIEDVWALLHDFDLMRWDNAARYDLAEAEAPEDGIHEHYRITYYYTELGMTVDWTQTWSYAIRKGTPEHPDEIIINYRKVDGTRFIAYWEGTLVLTRLADNITAITGRNQIKATRTDVKRNARTLSQLFGKLETGKRSPVTVSSR